MLRERDEERVTVVVPAWNAAATLGEALSSLVGQTHPADAVIVVDDASSDATLEIAATWASVLPLTVVAVDENEGPAGARDRGILTATTALIALLDADDVLLPDHLETLLAAHAASGAEIVSPNARLWDPVRGYGEGTYRDIVAVPPFEEQADEILRRDFVCTGALFERAAYDRAGGFRAEFTGSEPWDLWMRMIENGARVSGVVTPTLLYRVAEMSVSRGPAAFHSAAALFDAVCTDLQHEKHRLTIAERTRREVHARLELYLAYEAAAEGRPAAARRHARAAARGSVAIRARAAALLCAPALARRWRDRTVRHRRATSVAR